MFFLGQWKNVQNRVTEACTI